MGTAMFDMLELLEELYAKRRPKSIEEIYANEILQENNWEDLSKKFELTEEFLETFKNQVNWELVTRNKYLTLDLIDKFADYLDWNNITLNWSFSSESLKKFAYYINWDIYFDFYELPEDFYIEM